MVAESEVSVEAVLTAVCFEGFTFSAIGTHIHRRTASAQLFAVRNVVKSAFFTRLIAELLTMLGTVGSVAYLLVIAIGIACATENHRFTAFTISVAVDNIHRLGVHTVYAIVIMYLAQTTLIYGGVTALLRAEGLCHTFSAISVAVNHLYGNGIVTGDAFCGGIKKSVEVEIL